MIALSQVINPPTNEQMLERVIRQLGGLGWPNHTAGSGTGSVQAVSGTPTNDYDVVLRFLVAGELGSAEFQWSTDGGNTFSANVVVPLNGAWTLAGSGVSFLFSNSTVGAASFLVGDTFAIRLRRNGFPVTAWQEGSGGLGMAELEAEALAELWRTIQRLGASGFLLLAAELGFDAWVKLHAQQFYGVDAYPGATAKGVVVITDAGNQGPVTIPAGEQVVATAFGLRYLNDAPFTLPLGGSVSVPVTAEAVGDTYNVGNNSVTVLVTAPVAGATVTNPDPGTGSWLTAAGRNAETALALAKRCINRWPQLGIGVPTDNYDRWAKEAAPNVTKTTSAVSTTVPGGVDLWLASDSGPVSPGDVAAVEQFIRPRAPLTSLVTVASAAGAAITVSGTVYVTANLLAQAQAEGSANLARLFAGLPIGGKLWLTQVIDALQSPQGVRNVALTLPAADVQLSAAQVGTLTNSLTYSGV